MKEKIKKILVKYCTIYFTTLATIVIFKLLLMFWEPLEIWILNTLIFLIIISVYYAFLTCLSYYIIYNFILKTELKNIELSLFVAIGMLSYDLIPSNIIDNLDIIIRSNLIVILPVFLFIIYGLFVKFYLKRKN
jgi:hypothetical protein